MLEQEPKETNSTTLIRCFSPYRLLIALALSITPTLALAESIEGVWLGTQIETIGGDNPGVEEVTNPRMLIYTEGFFMLNFELADRPATGNNATDAQIANAARNYTSWGGTYMLDGTDIVYIRRITLNPNGMLPENQPTIRTIRALTATMLETSVTNDEGVTTVLRYRRVE